MEVKEAVAAAKRYIQELFADEDIADIGLEEVEFDDARNIWNITTGFSRVREPIDAPRSVISSHRNEGLGVTRLCVYLTGLVKFFRSKIVNLSSELWRP